MNAFNPYQQYQPNYAGYVPPMPQAPMQTGYAPGSFGSKQAITGRVVSKPEEITVQEVPTDGTLAWFPSSDGSCVYAKRWTPDGSIVTMRYIPEHQDTQQKAADPIESINQRLSDMFDMLIDIRDDVSAPTRTTTRRKAVKDDA